MTIDSQLTFRQHVARVISKAYGALKTLCHVKASLPTVTRILLYRTLVLPHLEYCSAIWDPHTAELTSKVERVQNRVMRYMLDKLPRTPSDSLRQQLNWQTLEERKKFHRAKLTYRILKELAPTCLHGKFHKNSEIGRAGGRNADNIYVIRPNTNWAKNSFHYRATLTWNSLDPTIKRETSLSYFLVCIKDLRGLFFYFWSFFLAIPVYVLYISDCICIYGSQEDQLSWWDLHIKIKFYLSRRWSVVNKVHP